MTDASPRDAATPPDTPTQAYARRVWQDVRALLIACTAIGIAAIAAVLFVAYRVAGLGGLGVASIAAIVGVALIARHLITSY
jgi:hypothetical protein